MHKVWSINVAYSSCWCFDNLCHVNSCKYAFSQLIIYIFTSSTNFVKFFLSEQFISFWLKIVQSHLFMEVGQCHTTSTNHIQKYSLFIVCQDKREIGINTGIYHYEWYSNTRLRVCWQYHTQILSRYIHCYHSSIPICKLPMVQNHSELNFWNQCISVQSGPVTFVVQFLTEP